MRRSRRRGIRSSGWPSTRSSPDRSVRSPRPPGGARRPIRSDGDRRTRLAAGRPRLKLAPGPAGAEEPDHVVVEPGAPAVLVGRQPGPPAPLALDDRRDRLGAHRWILRDVPRGGQAPNCVLSRRPLGTHPASGDSSAAYMTPSCHSRLESAGTAASRTPGLMPSELVGRALARRRSRWFAP
jgi:hypothetical protein